MTHVHLIGIGGTGLSAIARLLLESGYTVSGSDRTPNAATAELSASGVRVFIGHAPENIHGADLIIRSSAIPTSNPEILAAEQAGIMVTRRHEFLGQLMAASEIGIAISGTHGKTTTTAMIAWVLTRMGQNPGYIIGGVSKNLGSNAHAGSGKYFVLEADEYDRTFLGLQPDVIVLTNMEHDHPDCYPTPADYRQAFAEFIGRVKPGGKVLICRDDAALADLATEVRPGLKTFSYGVHTQADYRALNIRLNGNGVIRFDAILRRENGEAVYLAEVKLPVPGEHNVRNALAALSVIHLLGLPLEPAAAALSEYSGTGRRFDVRGEAGGITIVDDYAHHPTEIAATLSAARARHKSQRIWAVWQPHTYTRLQAFLPDYLTAFKDADRIIVTNVYGAREQNDSFSMAEIAVQIPNAVHQPSLRATALYLLEQLQPGDVVLVLSAGDADWISRTVFESLRQYSARETIAGGEQ